MAFNLRKFQLNIILKVVALLEMLFWLIVSGLAAIQYAKSQNEIKTRGLKQRSAFQYQKSRGSGRSPNADSDSKTSPEEDKWLIGAIWLLVSAVLLFAVQFILLYGTIKKNRCLLFCWILFSLVFGVTRIYLAQHYSNKTYEKALSYVFGARIIFFVLVAVYMLEITNERQGQEEVEPPQFRPQTLDPRQYREGLNYPQFPRSLEFADRVVGMNKYEHAHPKHWVPTYEAIDDEGRMVVVVDNPVYDAL